ncbi:DUF4232 domain-containing protein [Streptomyces sp. NBC_01020]|uniref:DUF4232 domain-containing protein n=1 Tax=unclassified Streptomyces TaxID=2593676 RepID=UPI00225B1570|nr:DUF4232 domain-containing protein [Streptomyces sp. NBC_01306]MCX4724725.1 DUF4232 domain-containing protein [Streptomyces sp. NBC_01306]WSV05790.1 DUF4232 domain-containing protein [Streptomyces sp. NBC_01020]
MTAKLNRVARCAAAVLTVVAVGAGAAACDSSSGSGASKTSAQSGAGQDSSSTAQGGSQDKPRSGTTAEGSAQHKVKSMSQEGSRTDAVNPVPASAPATGSSRCHTGELGYTWGGPHGGAPDMNDSTDQQIASIALKNRSDRTCTLRGFPGVRLISKTGEAWDLRRSSDTPSTMTLHPGESTASISIMLLAIPADTKDTKPFVPSKVLITPPNETTHVTLDWPYGGAILDQSGATHPGTFVSPVGI